jgi:hypothetical protein
VLSMLMFCFLLDNNSLIMPPLYRCCCCRCRRRRSRCWPSARKGVRRQVGK